MTTLHQGSRERDRSSNQNTSCASAHVTPTFRRSNHFQHDGFEHCVYTCTPPPNPVTRCPTPSVSIATLTGRKASPHQDRRLDGGADSQPDGECAADGAEEGVSRRRPPCLARPREDEDARARVSGLFRGSLKTSPFATGTASFSVTTRVVLTQTLRRSTNITVQCTHN